MQKRVRASWSEPYLKAELHDPIEGFRVETASAGPVHGASDLRLIDGRLWIAQDDSAFVAVLDCDPAGRISESCRAELHPLFPQLAATHGTSPVPKSERPDIEALARLQTPDGLRLLALSSGATAPRRFAALLDPAKGNAPLLAQGRLESFFEHLAVRWDIVGTELNLEGALGLGDRVRFLQRGNGALRGNRQGHNTVFDIGLADWNEYLQAAFRDPAAPFHYDTIFNIFGYDLGKIDSVRLTFSGADEFAAEWSLYTGSAEDCADVFGDGPTVGAVLGLLASDGRALQTPLRAPDGSLVRQKVEGIAALGSDTDAIEVLLAVDPDGAGASPFLHGVLHGPLVARVLEETTARPLR
ncbi:MAG: hypothetical protein HY303_07700 [Candidatus Wallbacteria bacterium]|nr:hypothetical protein [Candidatus Wallbacteria bacterium]